MHRALIVWGHCATHKNLSVWDTRPHEATSVIIGPHVYSWTGYIKMCLSLSVLSVVYHIQVSKIWLDTLTCSLLENMFWCVLTTIDFKFLMSMYIHSKIKKSIRGLSQRGQMSGPLALLFRICTRKGQTTYRHLEYRIFPRLWLSAGGGWFS